MLLQLKKKTESIGIQSKPQGCLECPFRKYGFGFVPDYVPSNPKIAIQLEAPGEQEALENTPLVGRAGKFHFKTLIEPLGYTREDCLISNTLRCRPPNNIYPKSKLRKEAELQCRRYDDDLKNFNPNLFVITLHPAALLRSSAVMRLVKRDVQKAFEFAEEGYRPLLLMGDKALSSRLPYIHSVKNFRGHFGEFRFGLI